MRHTPQVHDLPGTGFYRDKVSLVGRTQSATRALRLVPCA